MKIIKTALLAFAVLGLSMATTSTGALGEEDLTDDVLETGFLSTVFGAEFSSAAWQTKIVKKFTEPVRFYVDNRASRDRRTDVLAFIASLPDLIHGLEVSIVNDPQDANFRIFVVDRGQYRDIARREVYRNPVAHVPGRCLARVVSGRRGIKRSDAIIVSDEGEFLFNRCLVEETLQGLGPVNDSRHLPLSVFNDTSKHSKFTRHDRYIMNLLYDARIRPGMDEVEVKNLLPAVIQDARYVMR